MNKYQRFKEGIKNLTPVQKIQARVTGTFWGVIGLTIALCGMLYNLIFVRFTVSQLGFSIFVCVLIVMQAIQYIDARQQLAIMKEAEEKAEEMGILNQL